jgi:hypothetical protein
MGDEKVQNVGIIVNQSIEIGDREVIVYLSARRLQTLIPMPCPYVKRK